MSERGLETENNQIDPLNHGGINLSIRNEKLLRILIVDDEQFNIDALKIMLMYHCNIATIDICDSAFNGEEALQAVINNVEKNQGLSCDYELN